ncbi:MAG TPA: heparin lyase I family protein [Miltoncostaea sp.]|nr:heparin lyase I family protein [Miltoncostaea sp.]
MPPSPAAAAAVPGCLVSDAGAAVPDAASAAEPAPQGSWTAPEPLGIDADGAAAVVMPTGEVLWVGADARGRGVAGVFDPAAATTTPVDVPADASGRPYDLSGAGVALLPDGTVLVVGGGPGASARALVFDPVTRTWTVQPRAATARRDPVLTTLSDGRIAIADGSAPDAGIDVFAPGEEPGTPGTFTTLPAADASGPAGAAAPAAGEATPGDAAPAEPAPRTGLVPLPGGEVLALGDPADVAAAPALFAPAASAWAPVAGQRCARTAASTAVPLPDGRILSAGRDGDAGTDTYEIFTPPSLSAAARPAITGGDRTVAFGADLVVTTPDAARVATVLLVTPAAVSHGVDPRPSAIPLAFTVDGETLRVTAPPEGDGPPGHRMLVVVDATGVASPARWVAVGTPFRPPDPPDADLAPPVVDAVSPGAGSGGVPLDADIVVDLDEPIDPATLDRVRLTPLRRGARTIAVTPTAAHGGTRLVLSPIRRLAAGRGYRVTLPAGIADVAGNATEGVTSWTFTTADAGEPVVRPEPTPAPDPVPSPPRPVPQPPGPVHVPPDPVTPDPVTPGPPAPDPGGVSGLPGALLRTGDYDTGDLSQWSGHQSLRPYSLTLVHSPARQGAYAARFEVRAGDDPICAAGGGCYGDRSEVQMGTNEREGDERWYSWSTMFAPDFPRYSAWQVVSQWHAQADGSPPIGFFVQNDQLVLEFHRYAAPGQPIDIVDAWRGPLDRGRWQDIRLHVKWSGSDAVGFVELWINGVQQTFDDGGTRRRIRTMYPGVGNYFKQGLYRQGGLPEAGVVYHDGFRMSSAG